MSGAGVGVCSVKSANTTSSVGGFEVWRNSGDVETAIKLFSDPIRKGKMFCDKSVGWRFKIVQSFRACHVGGIFLEEIVRRTVDAYFDRIVDVSIVVPEILSPKRRLTIFYLTLPRAFSGSVIFTALLLDTLPNAVKTKPIKQTFQDVWYHRRARVPVDPVDRDITSQTDTLGTTQITKIARFRAGFSSSLISQPTRVDLFSNNFFSLDVMAVEPGACLVAAENSYINIEPT